MDINSYLTIISIICYGVGGYFQNNISLLDENNKSAQGKK